MKWITHQTAALLGAASLGAPWASFILLVPGAILPDLIDLRLARLGRGGRHKQKVFNKVHRGASHWFGWWLGLLFLTLCLPLPSLVRDILAGLALGAFSHVLMDMLTPKGVPLLPFSRWIFLSTPVCTTGTFGERVFLHILVIVGLLFLWLRFQDSLG